LKERNEEFSKGIKPCGKPVIVVDEMERGAAIFGEAERMLRRNDIVTPAVNNLDRAVWLAEILFLVTRKIERGSHEKQPGHRDSGAGYQGDVTTHARSHDNCGRGFGLQ